MGGILSLDLHLLYHLFRQFGGQSRGVTFCLEAQTNVQWKVPAGSGWTSANLGIHQRGHGTLQGKPHPIHTQNSGTLVVPDGQHNPDVFLLNLLLPYDRIPCTLCLQMSHLEKPVLQLHPFLPLPLEIMILKE